MANTSPRLVARLKRKKRIRKNIFGNQDRPRLSVFRSNKEIYAQLVDDNSGKTLVATSSRDKAVKKQDGGKVAVAGFVGKVIGEKAIEAGITDCAFDRNGYLYHGRVKALAEAARKAGLKF